ncbi:hypothetical protein C9374_008208 [Naegleria lovaniensis]|uniref:tRNA (guanine(9)-N(1))-methyltransferase n=1 Tax=Naegleria lovaniensis TaxID=51637 RepID=A0AA88KL73_NAELO|nr:uncharacterized protein C9374_008208 [Naegleria lovaniensis]KAG2378569.1 hypothetical protein C9374_008208 [Naegleria lovaniensis]
MSEQEHGSPELAPSETNNDNNSNESVINNNDEKHQDINNNQQTDKKLSKEEKLQKRKERWDNKREKFKNHKKKKKEIKQEQKKKESDEFFEKLREELSKEEFDKLMEENKKKKEARIESQRKQKEEMHKKLQQVMTNGLSNDSNVCINIDCSFNDKMTDGEIVSLSQQLGKCYAAYRKMSSPFYLTATSLDGALYEDMKKFEGFPEKWLMHHTTNHFTKEFEKQYKENKIIYLSADAEEEITEFQNGYVYVIGGIIDRNRHKNLCNTLAKDDYKLPTAKFPLEKHVDMKAATVLTTNQCVEIIATVMELKQQNPSQSHDDIWNQALQQIIPLRKRKV